jgi:hypothetical protein
MVLLVEADLVGRPLQLWLLTLGCAAAIYHDSCLK